MKYWNTIKLVISVFSVSLSFFGFNTGPIDAVVCWLHPTPFRSYIPHWFIDLWAVIVWKTWIRVILFSLSNVFCTQKDLAKQREFNEHSLIGFVQELLLLLRILKYSLQWICCFCFQWMRSYFSHCSLSCSKSLLILCIRMIVITWKVENFPCLDICGTLINVAQINVM